MTDFKDVCDAVAEAIATDKPIEAVAMAAILANAKDKIYEPLRIIAEDQSGGSCLAAVMVGITDADDGFCFVTSVPKDHRREMAKRLRHQAFQLENQDD